MGENKTLMQFIYLFKAPTDDSNLVNIFEMSDLFYRSTPYSLEETTQQETKEEPTQQEIKEDDTSITEQEKQKEEYHRQNAINDYLKDSLSLNEELFYTKLQTIMENCINENKLYDLFVLLRDNHLIKASS